jgi:hypothetical protein
VLKEVLRITAACGKYMEFRIGQGQGITLSQNSSVNLRKFITVTTNIITLAVQGLCEDESRTKGERVEMMSSIPASLLSYYFMLPSSPLNSQ